jgi:hypothetical protein
MLKFRNRFVLAHTCRTGVDKLRLSSLLGSNQSYLQQVVSRQREVNRDSGLRLVDTQREFIRLYYVRSYFPRLEASPERNCTHPRVDFLNSER